MTPDEIMFQVERDGWVCDHCNGTGLDSTWHEGAACAEVHTCGYCCGYTCPPTTTPKSVRSDRTSYRAKPEESKNEYGVMGHFNIWGGFHGTTDPYAYIGLLGLVARNLHRPRVARWLCGLIWERWVHRRCDVMDFHHYGCTLSAYGKKLDDEYRWRRTWVGE